MKRFCRRSYNRPTMVVSPTLRPEYAYDPSANPVSLKPAGSGAGSAFASAVSWEADVAVWAARAAGASSQRVQRATVLTCVMARPPGSRRFRLQFPRPQRAGSRLAEDDGRGDFRRVRVGQGPHLGQVEPQLLHLGRDTVAADHQCGDLVCDQRHDAHADEVGQAADALRPELAR